MENITLIVGIVIVVAVLGFVFITRSKPEDEQCDLGSCSSPCSDGPCTSDVPVVSDAVANAVAEASAMATEAPSGATSVSPEPKVKRARKPRTPKLDKSVGETAPKKKRARKAPV